MLLTLYFVALVKNGNISFLKSGPFISEELANNSKNELPVQLGACEWKIVKSDIPADLEILYP